MASPKKKAAKPSAKPATRRASSVSKKAPKPMRDRKLGIIGEDPPR